MYTFEIKVDLILKLRMGFFLIQVHSSERLIRCLDILLPKFRPLVDISCLGNVKVRHIKRQAYSAFPRSPFRKMKALAISMDSGAPMSTNTVLTGIELMIVVKI